MLGDRRECLDLQRSRHFGMMNEQADQGFTRDLTLNGVIQDSGRLRCKGRGIASPAAIDDDPIRQDREKPVAEFRVLGTRATDVRQVGLDASAKSRATSAVARRCEWKAPVMAGRV